MEGRKKVKITIRKDESPVDEEKREEEPNCEFKYGEKDGRKNEETPVAS